MAEGKRKKKKVIKWIHQLLWPLKLLKCLWGAWGGAASVHRLLSFSTIIQSFWNAYGLTMIIIFIIFLFKRKPQPIYGWHLANVSYDFKHVRSILNRSWSSCRIIWSVADLLCSLGTFYLHHKAMLDGIKPNGLNQMATHDFNFLCNVQERLTREDQEQFSLITLHWMILILLSSRYWVGQNQFKNIQDTLYIWYFLQIYKQ